MEYVTLDRLPRKRLMVCQNTLPKNSWNPTDPNSSHDFSLDFFTAEVAAFRASVYRDCKSDDDLFSIMT